MIDIVIGVVIGSLIVGIVTTVQIRKKWSLKVNELARQIATNEAQITQKENTELKCQLKNAHSKLQEIEGKLKIAEHKSRNLQNEVELVQAKNGKLQQAQIDLNIVQERLLLISEAELDGTINRIYKQQVELSLTKQADEIKAEVENAATKYLSRISTMFQGKKIKKNDPTQKELATLLLFYKEVGTERFITEFGDMVGLQNLTLQLPNITSISLPTVELASEILVPLAEIESKQIALRFDSMNFTEFNRSCLAEYNLKHQTECFRVAATALEWRCRTHASGEYNQVLQIVMGDDFNMERLEHHQYLSDSYYDP